MESSLPIGAPNLFSSHRYVLHKQRSRLTFSNHNFLHQLVEKNILDRLEEIKRSFKNVLILGTRSPRLEKHFSAVVLDDFPLPDGDGLFNRPLAKLASDSQVREAYGTEDRSVLNIHEDLSTGATKKLAAEVEFCKRSNRESYPFRPQSFDLILSLLTLHWINDLPGVLAQIRYLLKPDGLFMGALFGGDTLMELSTSFFQAESRLSKTTGLRVAPMVSTAMMGALLQRAGFALPVTDVDRLIVYYSHIVNLMKDLRGMGESNNLLTAPPPLTRSLIEAAQDIYAQQFSEGDQLKASFHILYATGWAPSENQPKALKPGSGRYSLTQEL